MARVLGDFCLFQHSRNLCGHSSLLGPFLLRIQTGLFAMGHAPSNKGSQILVRFLPQRLVEKE